MQTVYSDAYSRFYMVFSVFGDRDYSAIFSLPTILVVQDHLAKINQDSTILAQCNIVYISLSPDLTVLNWIQQNQPDLILLNLKNYWQNALNLITSLRLDWLTRDIPIIVTGNKLILQSINNQDYDFALINPYSKADLEQAVCALIPHSACSIALDQTL